MTFYYVDASAWVKRYYLEKGTEWVQAIFSGVQSVGCSSLGVVEVMATLSRKHKAREISTNQFKQKARELEDDWPRFVQIHLSAETVTDAIALAKKLALRGSDAVHLSSALLLQRICTRSQDDLFFVASDRELKEAARSSGLKVIDPTEQPG